MTPLSVVCPTLRWRLLGLTGALLTLAACASEPVSSAGPKPVVQPKPACSAPPPVADIWNLEPLLIEQGLIDASMNREQREQAIRTYIQKKNRYFLEHCQEKK